MPAQDLVYYGNSNKKTIHSPSNVRSSSSMTIAPKNDDETYRRITKEMYKQNLELAIRNKTLLVLRSLYTITMSTLDVVEVAQRIVDAVATELKFSAVLISLVDYKQKVLRLTAINRSRELIRAVEFLGKPLAEITIPLDYINNLAINVLKDKERKITSNMLDILTPQATQEEADQIERISNIKTLVIYPLYLGEKAVGVLNIGLGKRADDLSRAERETLEELIGLVSIAMDRARLHEDLRQANEKLQELDKLKDEFVSLASHELRTPMTAIKGSLSTILEGYAGEISDQSKEFLTAAYNENDRLIRLVNNLLNISRIEAGRFTFTIVKLVMDKLCKEVVHNLEMAAKEKSLYLKYEVDGKLPFVKGDEDKVKEVLINLIGNAIKFTHKGGITVRSMVKNKMVETSVTDTGSGISKEDQALLFKKFSQARGSYAKQVGGTGLGLYISKQIIEGQGGQVWLESTLGKGSTFYFTLPIME